jgi:hypothetical protein
MHWFVSMTQQDRLLSFFTIRPGDRVIDWQGMSLLLSSNSVLIIILALIDLCLLLCSLFLSP